MSGGPSVTAYPLDDEHRRALLTIAGCMGMQGPPIKWCAIHRRHHQASDREGDPHSPRLHGLWPLQLGNVFYYVREARNPDVVELSGEETRHR